MHIRSTARCLTFLFLLAAPARADEFPVPQLSGINPAGIDGALVICGGGELPPVAIEQFVELAGGEDAKLVVIPTASNRADQADDSMWMSVWNERGIEPHPNTRSMVRP